MKRFDIQDIWIALLAILFLIHLTGHSHAQTTSVVCRTPGGNEVVVQGRSCPAGYVFVRYLF